MNKNIELDCLKQKPLDLEKIFQDVQDPVDKEHIPHLTSQCLYCYDPPCVQACPTEIRIPEFIQRISTNNAVGAGEEILKENPLGGTCGRVCPVESLCEKACVKNKLGAAPVEIGRLQRYAVDQFFLSQQNPFKRESKSGKRVAVVGAGPAGLSCAFRLALQGHQIVLFDKNEKLGGLNEYGIAPYKMVEQWAQTEIDFILKSGDIDIKPGVKLGTHISLAVLQEEFDAVFLSLGLENTNVLGLEHENIPGIYDAVDYISSIRQAEELSQITVAKRVAVIGGGSTAIDIASQMKKLGAEEVAIYYRRAKENMGATLKEKQFVENQSIKIFAGFAPKKIYGNSQSGVQAIDFARVEIRPSGALWETGETLKVQADMVFKAIGQRLPSYIKKISGIAGQKLKISQGKIWVNAARETSIKGVFAGGDCIGLGQDLTVYAVQDGKIAADSIEQQLKDRKD